MTCTIPTIVSADPDLSQLLTHTLGITFKMSYDVEDTHVRRMDVAADLQQATIFHSSKRNLRESKLSESMCGHQDSVASQ